MTMLKNYSEYNGNALLFSQKGISMNLLSY